MGGLIPNLRSVVVSGVDPGPRPHTEKGAPMGGQALADTRPPSIKGKGMGGPNSDLSQYFRGSFSGLPLRLLFVCFCFEFEFV